MSDPCPISRPFYSVCRVEHLRVRLTDSALSARVQNTHYPSYATDATGIQCTDVAESCPLIYAGEMVALFALVKACERGHALFGP